MKTSHATSLVAAAVLGLSACGSDKTGGTGTEFQACLASVQKKCTVAEQDTAEKLETACASVTLIPIPLADGTTYGPITIDGGPYAAKIEWNEGAGTEFVNPVNVAEPVCPTLGVQSFNEPASVNAELLNLRGIDYSLYTIFRPACMKAGEKYPVITWANGTCGFTHGYGALLGHVASHGFVVIASNSTWTATAPTDTVQLRALDYAEALNNDPASIYYQKLDLGKVGAMGHSQGSMATATASSDPRIKALILWNGGTSNNKPFLYVSGDRDVSAATTPASMAERTVSATQPGAWVYYHQILETGGTATGHLVLMEQPERVIDMTVAWWKYMLHGDQDAKKTFMGDSCTLCNRTAELEYGHNSLLR
jgi:pimeloyl-ACP methyl ester carboxylesterase